MQQRHRELCEICCPSLDLLMPTAWESGTKHGLGNTAQTHALAEGSLAVSQHLNLIVRLRRNNTIRNTERTRELVRGRCERGVVFATLTASSHMQNWEEGRTKRNSICGPSDAESSVSGWTISHKVTRNNASLPAAAHDASVRKGFTKLGHMQKRCTWNIHPITDVNLTSHITASLAVKFWAKLLTPGTTQENKLAREWKHSQSAQHSLTSVNS